MTNLKCNAKNCMHNESPYCCISHICVGGINAKTESEPCCDNFQERRENAVNSCRSHEKNPSVDIECKACNCVYNEDYRCQAKEVCISGPSACVCDETRCSTFKAR